MKRLDLIVAEKTGARTYAKELIVKGLVEVNGKICEKPGAAVGEDDDVVINAEKMKYVSRGGYKLEAAIEFFGIPLTGAVCGDIGASTGGFADCMLQHNAAKVYCVDVGKNQLAEPLKNDERIISIENTDVREVKLPEKLDFSAVDVSFISVTKIAGNVIAMLKENGCAVWLIKPQFEVGKGNTSKGIVKNAKLREKAVEAVVGHLKNNGLIIKGIIESPITGGDGNIEYLAYTYGGNNEKN